MLMELRGSNLVYSMYLKVVVNSIKEKRVVSFLLSTNLRRYLRRRSQRLNILLKLIDTSIDYVDRKFQFG